MFQKIQQQLENIPIGGSEIETAREQLSRDIEEFFDWIVAATVHGTLWVFDLIYILFKREIQHLLRKLFFCVHIFYTNSLISEVRSLSYMSWTA